MAKHFHAKKDNTHMKQKLLITASTFPRWENDTEPRFILDLVSHLADEFDVTVLVPAAPNAKSKETFGKVKVIRYHYFPVHKWETLCYPGAIAPRIKEKKARGLLVPFLLLSLYFHLLILLPKYDIVHAHWLIPQGIIQAFFRKPYIVTGHGGDVTSLNKGILRNLKIQCLKNASHVTVVSKHLERKVRELVPQIHPSVISMGVDTSLFGRRHRIPGYFNQGDRKVILFVGRLAEKKGVTYLIEAMKQVDALLIIAGDGPLKQKLQAQAACLSHKVLFLGAKTHEDLKTIYASADIFAAPSITAKDGDQEGIPTAIMEAMASGLPVVASDSGGISQLITNGKNGLLCEEKNIGQLAEKLNLLTNDEQLYHQISRMAEESIKQYDYSVIAKKYAVILKTMEYRSGFHKRKAEREDKA